MLRIDKLDGSGSTLVAQRDIIATGDSPKALITCPEAYLIGPRLARTIFGEVFTNPPDSAPAFLKQALIKLSLLHERAKGSESELATYIDALPKTLDSPVFWTQEELDNLLEGTNLHGEVPVKLKQWHDEWDYLTTTTQLASIAVDMSVTTFEDYKWACGIFMSRAFPARIVYGDTPENEGLSMLIPVVDSLNHVPTTPVLWNCSKDSGFTFSVCGNVAEGHEIFNNYGPKSNEELLLGYGFCSEETRPFDFVMLKLAFPAQMHSLLKAIGLAENIQEEKPNSDKVFVVFRLELNKTLDEKLVTLFGAMTKPDNHNNQTGLKAMRITGLITLKKALTQKLNKLTAAVATHQNPNELSSEKQTYRFKSALIYREGQQAILEASISNCDTLVQDALASVPKTQQLDLKMVLQNKDGYFSAISDSIKTGFGMKKVKEFQQYGLAEEILSLVLAYERIKGEASRYFGTPLFEQGTGVRAVNAELRDSYESFYEGYVKQLLNTGADVSEEIYNVFGANQSNWNKDLIVEAGQFIETFGFMNEKGNWVVLI